MRLYVMRHGPAVDDSPSGRDDDRELTGPGRGRVRAVAQALLDAGEMPRVIVSSPLVRALSTAEIVAALGGLDGPARRSTEVPVQVRRELAPGGQTLRLASEILDENRDAVMVVGHEPDLSTLVGRLLGAPMPAAMGKAMVVGLETPGEGRAAARLRFVFEPKTLVWEHDARS